MRNYESQANNGTSMGLRMYFWRDAVTLISERPIFGWGTGSYAKVQGQLVADRSGAAYAVIVGTNELEAGTVVVRPLRAERPAGQGDAPAVSGQYDVARHDLIDHLTKALS